MGTKKAVNLLFFFVIVVKSSLQDEVLGFQYPYYDSNCIIRAAGCYLCSPSTSSSRLFFATNESRSFPECPPTIQNPVTKRMINLGGPTFNEFMKKGTWVQHQGTLKRLDLQTLRDYQQGISSNGNKSRFYDAKSDHERTTDEWYCITPSVLVEAQDERSAASYQADSNILLREQLLFVNKPSGLHCVPPRDLSTNSLSSQVATLYRNAKPCHRLDRDTSGIVVFGLTPEAHRDVSKQFELRTISKTYTALIAGHPNKDHGMIDMPIGKQKTKEGFNRWTIGGEKPRGAITKWRVDKTFSDADTGAKFSRVELEPKTGRGHQLRLHMKAMGCPILGDTIHGEDGVAACSPRLCLHALKLQVNLNGLRLECESVAPF